MQYNNTCSLSAQAAQVECVELNKIGNFVNVTSKSYFISSFLKVSHFVWKRQMEKETAALVHSRNRLKGIKEGII